jgi:hypothetical protein
MPFNLTFKDNLSIRTIERIVGLIQEIQSVQVSISENVLAIRVLGNHFNGPKSELDEIVSTADVAKFIINTDLPNVLSISY